MRLIRARAYFRSRAYNWHGLQVWMEISCRGILKCLLNKEIMQRWVLASYFWAQNLPRKAQFTKFWPTTPDPNNSRWLWRRGNVSVIFVLFSSRFTTTEAVTFDRCQIVCFYLSRFWYSFCFSFWQNICVNEYQHNVMSSQLRTIEPSNYLTLWYFQSTLGTMHSFLATSRISMSLFLFTTVIVATDTQGLLWCSIESINLSTWLATLTMLRLTTICPPSRQRIQMMLLRSVFAVSIEVPFYHNIPV